MTAFDAAGRARAVAWFTTLRDRLCAAFEAIEAAADAAAIRGGPAGRFVRTPWVRPGGGGGTMAILRGRVLEKAGVNISEVEGEFSEALRGRIPGAADDPRFWAAGISVVVHPASPKVPAAHMNTRMVVTTRGWFGGGADLTPTVANADDTAAFHAALAAACDGYAPGAYARYKDWCDRYFYLPHRGEARGAGGIFFDDLTSGDDDRDWERDFAFVQAVGVAFLDVYPAIIRRWQHAPWTAEEKQAQLVKRGRYVEFNLLYDRGTRFGIETGGNPDAVLMSLPPLAGWP